MVRVRFAPSPTGSLHLGNALSAVANRRFADEHGGTLLLRIDDTDAGAERRGRRGGDRRRPRVARASRWDEGPVRQSERFVRHREAAHLIGEPDAEGALRFGRTTLLRADGSPTYQLATRRRRRRLRDHARHPRHRPPRERGAAGGADPRARRRAAGVRPPRPAARRGRHEAVEAARRVVARRPARGGHSRPRRCARTSRSSACRSTTSTSTSRALRRLSIEALAALSDEELAARVGVPVSVAPVLRGARDLAEAREYAEQVLEPQPVDVDAPETLARFRELVESGLEREADRPRAEGGRRRPEGAPARADRARARAGARGGDRGAAAGRAAAPRP